MWTSRGTWRSRLRWSELWRATILGIRLEGIHANAHPMKEATFGIGAYTPAEASRLTGVPSASLRRWLFGYRYDHHGPLTVQRPLWQPQYGIDQDEPLLGFRDLIEARIVGQLRNLNFGMPTIRECLNTATEIANDTHPFSSAGFKTDGRRLFLERIGAGGSRDVIDLGSRQHQFAQIIERSFIDLQFDSEKAIRWYLLSRKQTIVADPERSFGQPIVTDSGIPTSRLAEAVEAEGSVAKVARLFELSISVVRDALIFENRLEAAVAA